MKLLWTKDLKMNTVHVRDVVRALWHLKDAGPPGEIYNLVDKGETSKRVLYSGKLKEREKTFTSQ